MLLVFRKKYLLVLSSKPHKCWERLLWHNVSKPAKLEYRKFYILKRQIIAFPVRQIIETSECDSSEFQML